MIKQLVKKFQQKVLPKNYMTSPDWIKLGVNNVCNLGCNMNDVSAKNIEANFVKNLIETHPLNISIDLIKIVIDQIATYYPKVNLGYAFNEHLFYPYNKESIAHIEVVFKQ
jgi:Fe-coproporphyrin III synthase